VVGYAAALEAFDAGLPELFSKLKPGDLLMITADHGCDPTWRGTDHTREFIPIVAFGPGVLAGDSGQRSTFSDIGATVAQHLKLGSLTAGAPLWN
jgi:phosphopentomutase